MPGDADSWIMDSTNRNNQDDTIRIRRPSRVYTDDLGHTVWMGAVEPCELELEGATDAGSRQGECAGVWLRLANA